MPSRLAKRKLPSKDYNNDFDREEYRTQRMNQSQVQVLEPISLTYPETKLDLLEPTTCDNAQHDEDKHTMK